MSLERFIVSTMNKSVFFKSCAVILLIFSLTACERTERIPVVDFNDTFEPKAADKITGPGINVCVGSMITPEQGYAYYKKLLDYIGKELKTKINFIEKRTYGEVNNLLKNGSIDVAFVCGGPYVVGYDDFGLQLLVAPVVEGETVYYSYIIASKEGGIDNFDQLKGKKFAFADPMSNTGKLVPTYMIQELGYKPENFFEEFIYTYSHDNSIKAVAQGIVDAAAVDSLIWEYMHKSGCKYTVKTKIIKVSRPYGIPPVVVRPGLDENLQERIKDIFVKMHVRAEGREILEGMYIDKFVEVNDSSYDTIRELKALVGE